MGMAECHDNGELIRDDVFFGDGLWQRGRRGALWAVNYVVGALSGFAGGATTLAGPPIALFWLGGGADVATFRANVIAFFALTEGLAILVYGARGLYTGPVLALCLALVG